MRRLGYWLTRLANFLLLALTLLCVTVSLLPIVALSSFESRRYNMDGSRFSIAQIDRDGLEIRTEYDDRSKWQRTGINFMLGFQDPLMGWALLHAPVQRSTGRPGDYRVIVDRSLSLPGFSYAAYRSGHTYVSRPLPHERNHKVCIGMAWVWGTALVLTALQVVFWWRRRRRQREGFDVEPIEAEGEPA